MHVVEAKARVGEVNNGEGWGVCRGKLLPTELCEIRRPRFGKALPACELVNGTGRRHHRTYDTGVDIHKLMTKWMFSD